MFATGHAIVRAPVPRGAPPAAASPEAEGRRAPRPVSRLSSLRRSTPHSIRSISLFNRQRLRLIGKQLIAPLGEALPHSGDVVVGSAVGGEAAIRVSLEHRQ